MPYIKQEDRQRFRNVLNDDVPSTPGELNYLITYIIMVYLRNRTRNYQTINDIVGALEGAKLEFYRRVAAPYEDTKIKENGDVY